MASLLESEHIHAWHVESAAVRGEFEGIKMLVFPAKCFAPGCSVHTTVLPAEPTHKFALPPKRLGPFEATRAVKRALTPAEEELRNENLGFKAYFDAIDSSRCVTKDTAAYWRNQMMKAPQDFYFHPMKEPEHGTKLCPICNRKRYKLEKSGICLACVYTLFWHDPDCSQLLDNTPPVPGAGRHAARPAPAQPYADTQRHAGGDCRSTPTNLLPLETVLIRLPNNRQEVIS